MEHLADSPLTQQQIKSLTHRDPLLSHILQYLSSGWPTQCDQKFKPFLVRKEELSLLDGCILWGSRVVIPSKATATVLQELHEGHPGITRMKQNVCMVARDQ